ncbi:DNA polymerase [Spirochaetia bacterium]|nr:DNA polymerase [Spirochaetia bacterium]
MKYGLSDYTLQTLDALFKKHSGIKRVTVYGSRAKGTYHPGSDIDITLHTDETFTYNDLLHLANEVDDSDMPYFVDISVYDKLQNMDLKEHIQRIGKPLYVRQSEGAV